MSAIETEAIVLRRFDYSESSQVAHLLTPLDGRISVLAKGIKRPGAALKGPMDLFQYAEVRYLRRKGMDLLVRYRPLTGFSPLRDRLDSLFSAFYITELAWTFAQEGVAEPTLFSLLGRALAGLALADAGATPGLVVAAEMAFLETTGLSLSLGSCAGCGSEGAADTVLFPRSGGHLCFACRRDRAGSTALTAGAWAALERLASDEPHRARRFRLSPPQIEELRSLMDSVMVGVTERTLRSARFLRSGVVGHPGRNVSSSGRVSERSHKDS